MEVHKTAEPRFTRNLKTLIPYLSNLRVAETERQTSLNNS